MPSSFVVRAVMAVAVLLSVPAAVRAQSQPASPAMTSPAPVVGERAPFSKNVIGLEFGAGLFTEAWNFNSNYEWIGDGSFAVWWAFTQGKALVVEFHAAGVSQDRPRAAFVNGVMPIFRWRLLERGPNSMFVEFGAGVSWSDTEVPPRGTRFNYLIVTSAGLTHRLTSQVHAVASVRVLHISNASLKGPNRNPDIEAVGGYFGIFVGF